jgi:hypothetical protein|tara:strand:- start:5889 stop:6701 length:813 start_codon:yes stop_codon:yes gene_type:complete
MIAARAVNASLVATPASTSSRRARHERTVSFRAAVRATERASFASTRCASRRSSRRASASPTAFLWWSREKEIRKRWKQLCEFAADEIPAASPLGGSKGLIRWVGEYPLTAASVATAVAGGVSAAISAAVLPVVVGVAVLALPGLLLMFVGTAAVASLVGALVLLLSLPALGFLGVFGGSIAAAASAKLLPLAIIGSGLLFGAKTIEFGVSRDRDAERKLKAGADAADDPWSPTDVNARAAAEEEEDFEETVKANWDARFRALDGKRKQK